MAATTGQGKFLRSREGEEMWDSTVAGDIWLQVAGERGQQRDVVVRGFGRLRISPLDREIAQEQMVDADLDPFLNGSLIRIDADQQEDEKTQTPHALTTEEIMEVFNLTGGAFTARIDEMNELGVRRMMEMAEAVDATNSQIKYLKDTIETKWAVGGDTPSYRELKGLGQVAGG